MDGAIILASLVVGVALTDQLTSLHRLIRARRQVQWDWLPLVFALFVFLSTIMTWWMVADLSDGSMTIGAFLPTIVSLVLLFLLASASLPDPPEQNQPINLETFWASQARYLWTLLLFFIGFDIIRSIAAAMRDNGAIVDIVWARNFDVLLIALITAAIVVRRRWVDAMTLAVMAVGPVVWLERSLG